jgi:hypothetical protein
MTMQQPELAYQYGWIQSATLTQLFIWMTESFLDGSIKAFIQNRRKGSEVKSAKEVGSDHTQ